MKLFGEYLVEKKLVDEEALVAALIEQTRSIKSYGEVVYDQKLLKSGQILEIFKIQQIKQVGFVDAARETGVWTSELAEQIQKHWASTRVPLGQVLVKSGALTLEKMTHALDEYLGDVQDEVLKNPGILAPPKTNQSSAPAPSSPSPAAGQTGNVELFLETVNNERKEKLLGFFKQLNDGSGDPAVLAKLAPELGEIKNNVHLIKGAIRLVGNPMGDDLIGKLESSLQAVQSYGLEKAKQDLAQKVASIGTRSTEFVWRIAESLSTTGKPDSVLDSDEKKRALQELLSAIEVLGFDIQLLS